MILEFKFFTAAMYEAIAKIKCGVIFFKQM